MRTLVPLSLAALLSLTACSGGGKGSTGDDTGTGNADGADSVDADGDGSSSTEDCDDNDPAAFPGNPEACDGIDNNCDGATDEGVLSTFYTDADGDSFGDLATAVEACEPPAATVADATDCNDNDPTAFPGNPEACDGIDNNCDGTVDEGVLSTFYADADGDSFGDPATAVEACEPPAATVADATDCDDASAGTFPGNTELCDGIDTDCDAATTDAGLVTFTDATGATTDLTATFAAGTAAAPAAIALSDAGSLAICEGTHYVHLTVEADLAIGSPAADPSLTVLDGGSLDTVLTALAPATAVSITGLTLQNGLGTTGDPWGFGYTVGGNVNCPASGPTLSITNAALLDGDGGSNSLGGALFAYGCDLTLTDTALDGNRASWGGGILATDSAITLDGVSSTDNTADNGGAFAYFGLNGDSTATVEAYGTTDDGSTSNVGALFLDDATYTCVAEAGVGGITAASAAASFAGAALIFSSNSLLESAGCNFGADGTPDDNTPDDIYAVNSATLHGFGDDAWFTCDTNGCGPYTGWGGATGTLNFLYANFQTSPGVYDCDTRWDLALLPTDGGSLCDGCDFAFEGDATFNSATSASAISGCPEFDLGFAVALDVDSAAGTSTADAQLDLGAGSTFGLEFDDGTWDGSTARLFSGYIDYPVFYGYYYYSYGFDLTLDVY
jgi:hypothetical protein